MQGGIQGCRDGGMCVDRSIAPRPHDCVLVSGSRPNEAAVRLARGDAHAGADADLVQPQDDPTGSLDG